MTRNWLGPFLLFASLLLCSQVLLPALNVENLGPLFRWNLFAGIRPNGYFDLRVEKAGRQMLVSDEEFQRTEKYSPAWGLAQRLGGDSIREQNWNRTARIEVVQLNRILRSRDFIPLHVCRVKINFSDYMQLGSDEKGANCEDIPGKI